MDYTHAKSSVANASNYHDLSGLQAIKNEQSDEASLKKVAQQFESFFTHELLKNMRNANRVFEQDSLFESGDNNTFRDMYDQQLSTHLSSGRGLGLAEVIYKQLSRQYLPNTEPASRNGDHPVPARQELSQQTLQRQDSVTGNEGNDTASINVKFPSSAESAFQSARDFIDQLLPAAQKVAKRLTVNPLLLLAQAALETGWGKHINQGPAGESSHNLFNIKASADWSGPTVTKVSPEFRQGQWVQERSAFRQYENFEQSFDDYFHFLSQNQRYKNAVDGNLSDQQFISELQRAGYATDPNYAEKVLSVLQTIQRKVGAEAEITE